MLTKQLLLAVLQGFPFTHLRLNRTLLFFCQVVQSAIERGASPQQALALGLSQLAPHEREKLLRSLRESAAAQAETNLPPRQQELLAALRLSGPTTCGMLSRRIGQDRSNTRKRLTQLLASNHITRVNHWGAFFYFVLPAPPTSVTDLHQTIEAFIASAQANSYSTTNPSIGVPPTATTPSTPPTPLTSLTSLTPPALAKKNNSFHAVQDRPARTLYTVRDILDANTSPNAHSPGGLSDPATNRLIDQSTSDLQTSGLPDL